MPNLAQNHLPKSIWCALLAILWLPLGTQAVLDIPDVPLFLNATGVKPNFIMTLDDSGSMQWAYVPDNRNSNHQANRFKANSFNGMYYNPSIQYYPPPKYNRPASSGNCPLTSNPTDCYPNASFTAAPWNGFDTTRGTVDLSEDYRAVRVFAPNSTSQTYAGSPDGSSDRSYYANAVVPTTDYSIICEDVRFIKLTGEDRIRIWRDTDTSCPIYFRSQDSGQALTLECRQSDGCSGVDDRHLNPKDGDGNPIPYTINWENDDYRILVGDQPGWPNSQTDYRANTTKIRFTWSRPGNTSTTVYPAYYYLFYTQAGVARPSNCDAVASNQVADDDCYVRRWVGDTNDIYKRPDGSAATADEKTQNFANWYSYYRTRNLAMVSGTMSALTGLDDDTRVAWQALNTCNTFSATACKGWDNPDTGLDNRIQRLGRTKTTGKTHRQELYDWLARFPADGWTPLRTAAVRAGEYCDTAVTSLSASSPWAEDPPQTKEPHHGCRRNLLLLMTDGIWNTDNESTTVNVGNATNSDVDLQALGTKLPNEATSWTPGPPYTDNNSNSIADIAAYYWGRDLATDLPNNLSPLYTERSGDAMTQWQNPKNNPATWQHLTTYGISLGLGSVLVSPNPVWMGDTFTGGFESFKSGTAWPSTGSNRSPGNAYDMWHAAISGRGRFYSAESADQLTNAFKNVIDTVSSVASAGGGAGLGSNSTKISTNTTVYLATFSGDWSGSLQAIPLQSDGRLGTNYWDAGLLIPYAQDRRVYTRNSGSAENFDSCSASLQTALNKNIQGVADGLCSQRMSWLRGWLKVTGASWNSSTNRITYTVPKHGFATGDEVIVSNIMPATFNQDNGATVTVTSPDTFTVAMAADPGAYASGGTARYRAFRNRSSTVLGDIMNSDPIYSHKEDYGYGGASVTINGHDVYGTYVTGKAARTPMVYVGANDGMLHAFNAETAGNDAGKEVFAYVPAAVYDNLSKLTSPQYEHKFFVDGSPTVHDIYTGSGSGWRTYLVSGLGAGGRSVFALDVTGISTPSSLTASNVVKWEFTDSDLGLTFSQPQVAPTKTDQWAAFFGNGYNSGTGNAYLFVVDMNTGNRIAKVATNSATDNGLATPYLYDRNGDTIVDVVYAGDMKGNMWKFVVNSSGNWVLGNGGAPLFTASIAGNPQPITSQPDVLPHPEGGVMIYFGTGSYLTNSDLTDDKPQSFYGIWDNGTDGTVQRTSLQGQTITTAGTLRTSTSNAIDWTSTPSKRGWYMDFPATPGKPSERILSAPLAKDFKVIEDRVIFVTTTPTSDPCQRGGISWLMEVNTMTGGNPSGPVLDTNNDNVIDSRDATVSGKQLPDTLGISKTPLWVDGGEGHSGFAFKFFTGSKGTTHTEQNTDDAHSTVLPVKVYWKQVL